MGSRRRQTLPGRSVNRCPRPTIGPDSLDCFRLQSRTRGGQRSSRSLPGATFPHRGSSQTGSGPATCVPAGSPLRLPLSSRYSRPPPGTIRLPDPDRSQHQGKEIGRDDSIDEIASLWRERAACGNGRFAGANEKIIIEADKRPRMHPGNQRIEYKPYDEENRSGLSQAESPHSIEGRHRLFAHRAHQVVQAQQQSAQSQENRGSENDSSKQIYQLQAKKRILREEPSRKARIVDIRICNDKQDQQDRAANNHPTDRGRGPQITQVWITLLANG